MKTDWAETLNKVRHIPDLDVYLKLNLVLGIKPKVATSLCISSEVYDYAVWNIDFRLWEELNGD